jgi:hypothetical protein
MWKRSVRLADEWLEPCPQGISLELDEKGKEARGLSEVAVVRTAHLTRLAILFPLIS